MAAIVKPLVHPSGVVGDGDFAGATLGAAVDWRRWVWRGYAVNEGIGSWTTLGEFQVGQFVRLALDED